MKHSVEHLGFPKTAIETVAELRQVAGQRFGTDTVVDSPKIAFILDYAARIAVNQDNYLI